MIILEDFLDEAEVLDMPDDTLVAFVKTFGEDLYQALAEYMDSPEANPEVLNKLQDTVGDIVVRNTFHNQVNDKGLKATIYNCRLKVLPDMIYSHRIDADELIQDLTWLDGNTGNLFATLPVRTKTMFEYAQAKIIEYERNPDYAHVNSISENMTKWKNILFLPKRKNAKATGMRNLSMNKNRWRMQLKAAEYLKYCVEHGISQNVAREV